MIRRLQQALGQGQTFSEQPGADRCSRHLPKMTGKSPAAHGRSRRQTVQRVRLIEVGAHPVEHAGKAGIARVRSQGLCNELGLPALAMWRNNQMSCHAIGNFASQLLSQHVQAAVDGRCSAGRGQDLAVLEVEDIGVQADARVALGEILGKGPVGRCCTPVQQAGLGEDIGAEAEADHPGAPCMGGDQGVEQCVRGAFGRIVPTGDDDGVGGGQLFEAMVDRDRKAGGGCQYARLRSTDREIEGRNTRMGFSEYEAGS